MVKKGGRKFVLLSPFNDKKLVFKYTKTRFNSDDLIKCVRFFISDFLRRVPGLRLLLTKQYRILLRNNEHMNVSQIRTLCKMFNRVVRAYKKSTFYKKYSPSRINPIDYEVIEDYIYAKVFRNRVNINSNRPGFTDTVYGELRNKGFRVIMNEYNLTSNDTFVDMGSGIGLLVLQAAATSDVQKSIGIEVVEKTYNYSIKLLKKFKYVMAFGNYYFQKNIELHNKSFFDFDMKNKIWDEGTAIFVNDTIFSPKTVNKLDNDVFFNLKEGAKLVTSKDYVTRFSITHRKMDNVAAILHGHKVINAGKNKSYSCEDSIFHFYLIDRSLYYKFFKQVEKTKIGRKPRRSKSDYKYVYNFDS